MLEKIQVYPFNNAGVENLPTFFESEFYLRHIAHLESLCGSWWQTEMMRRWFDELWYPEAYKTGRFKTGGLIIDFTPLMKTYLVKYKYFGWQEQKAPCKMFIRENSVHPSYILKIVELEE